MYSTVKKQSDARIAVDVMLGNWSHPVAASLVYQLASSSVFNGAIFIMDEAMPGDWPPDPLTRTALKLGPGALLAQTAEGCLCCGLRSSLGDSMRQIFLDALARRRPIPSRMVILSEADDAEIYRQTLRHAAFLSQRYVLRYVWRIDSIGIHSANT
jgi:hypothetical protein